MQCHDENLVNFFSVTSDQWAKVYIGVVTSVWADIHLVPSVFLVYFECCLSVFVILTNMWPVTEGEKNDIACSLCSVLTLHLSPGNQGTVQSNSAIVMLNKVS